MSQNQKYVLIGMGAFGQEIAYTMKDYGADIIVMDKNPNTIAQLKRDGFQYAVQIDSTDAATLARFVTPNDLVILSMGESFEDNIITVGILTRIGVKKIYTRATKIIHEEILNQMKNTVTLFPEKEEGKRIALKLLYKEFNFIEEFAPGIFICELDVPSKFFGKTIIDLKLRNEYNINIIAMKEKQESGSPKIHLVGFENFPLNEHHIFVFLAAEKNMQVFLSES